MHRSWACSPSCCWQERQCTPCPSLLCQGPACLAWWAQSSHGTYTHTHTWTVHENTHIHEPYMKTHTCTHTHTHARMHARTHACMHAHTHTHENIHTHTWTYTHMNTHTHSLVTSIPMLLQKQDQLNSVKSVAQTWMFWTPLSFSFPFLISWLTTCFEKWEWRGCSHHCGQTG